jgi:filamentous hemagglutinin family protein
MKRNLLITSSLVSSLVLANNVLAADMNLPVVNNNSANITITNPDANSLQLNQQGAVGIINYDSYNVGAGKNVLYNFDTAGALSINKVISSGTEFASEIRGNIGLAGGSEFGNVVLINPNGVMFGPTANVNLGSLTVSTHNDYTVGTQAGAGFTAADISADGSSHTDWSNLRLENLSNYGIYIAEGAQITTTTPLAGDYGTILSSGAIVNAGKITSNGRIVLNNADRLTLNDTALAGSLSALESVFVSPTGSEKNPSTVEILKDDGSRSFATAAVDLKDSDVTDPNVGSYIHGSSVDMNVIANMPLLNPIVNLEGVINAQHYDIIVETEGQTASINVADSTKITSSGNTSIATGESSTPANTGDITVGNNVTIKSLTNEVQLITQTNSDGYNTGNIVIGDNFTSTAGSNFGLNASSNGAGSNSGNITVGNNFNVASNGAIAVTASSFGAGSTSGNINVGDDASMVSSSFGNVSFDTSAFSANSNAGDITVGNNLKMSSTNGVQFNADASGLNGNSGDITVGTNADLDGSTVMIMASSSGDTGGSGNISFGAGSDLDATSMLVLATSAYGDGSNSGNITLAENTNINSDGMLRIEASTSGDAVTSGNIQIGNNAVITATHPLVITTEAGGAGSTSGTITIGDDVTLISGTDMVEVKSEATGSGSYAGDLTIGDRLYAVGAGGVNLSVQGNSSTTTSTNLTIGENARIISGGGDITLTGNVTESGALSGNILVGKNADLDAFGDLSILSNSSGAAVDSGEIRLADGFKANANNYINIERISMGTNAVGKGITFEGSSDINSYSGVRVVTSSFSPGGASGDIVFNGPTTISGTQSVNIGTDATQSGDIVFNDNATLTSSNGSIMLLSWVMNDNGNAGDITFNKQATINAKTHVSVDARAVGELSNGGNVEFKDTTNIDGSGSIILATYAGVSTGKTAGTAGKIRFNDLTVDSTDGTGVLAFFTGEGVTPGGSGFLNPNTDGVIADPNDYQGATFTSNLAAVRHWAASGHNIEYIEPASGPSSDFTPENEQIGDKLAPVMPNLDNDDVKEIKDNTEAMNETQDQKSNSNTGDEETLESVADVITTTSPTADNVETKIVVNSDALDVSIDQVQAPESSFEVVTTETTEVTTEKLEDASSLLEKIKQYLTFKK